MAPSQMLFVFLIYIKQGSSRNPWTSIPDWNLISSKSCLFLWFNANCLYTAHAKKPFLEQLNWRTFILVYSCPLPLSQFPFPIFAMSVSCLNSTTTLLSSCPCSKPAHLCSIFNSFPFPLIIIRASHCLFCRLASYLLTDHSCTNYRRNRAGNC